MTYRDANDDLDFTQAMLSIGSKGDHSLFAL